jgi:serine/threonine protein kinase
MGQDTIPDHQRQDAQPGAFGRGIKILLSRDGHGPAQEEAEPPEHALPGPGEAIGQYEIIRELGRGGMGAVFLARDTRLGRRVAVKFLQTTSPTLADRFILEARATARCHHDNIIVIHEVGKHRGNPYMVLEYLRGSPLDELVGNGRRLPPGRAVELIVPVVRALVCAHEHGIVHRDLKPENIFVTESGTVKVLDFGIAKVVQDERPAPELLAAMEERSMPHLLAGLGENVDGDAPPGRSPISTR